ncbi:MAG: iron chelate uptake ABC transporter family permease subunit [Pirellulales bacterium]
MSYLVAIVLTGTALLGCVSGVVGSFAVLRRRALVSDLLSHAALPGICIAFIVAGGKHYSQLLTGAFLSGLLGVALVTLIIRWTRTKEDAAIGIVLSTFFGLGIVLSSLIQRSPEFGGTAGLERYTLGQAANITRDDVVLIAIVCAAALAVVVLLYKEFKLFSFDPDFARSQGWPTLKLDLAMMGLLGLVAVVGVKAVGVLLVPALLITPAVAARFWTNRLGPMLALSAIIGGLSAAAGTLLSAGVHVDWLGFDPLAFGNNDSPLPTGPLIVLCVTAVFLFSMLFAPRRGMAAQVIELVRLRQKTARENLLRTLYELSEPELPRRPIVSPEVLRTERAWTAPQARRLLRRAEQVGYIEQTGDGPRLTERGLAEAAAITRTHRLWELFLIQGANIASDHVDRDADSIEHFLPSEMVDDLESVLARQGRLPAIPGHLPESPHELPSHGREAPRA